MVRTILIFVLCVFVSCSNKPHIEYYPSGSIKKEHIYTNKRDTSTYLQKTYFETGQLETIGNYVKGNREGFWQGWYEDGDLSWTVEYENGKVKPLTDEEPFWEVIPIEKNEIPNFQVGIPQKIRIYIEGVEPEQMGIMTTNAKIEFPTQDNDYFFVITPQKEGNMLFAVVYKKNDEMQLLGKDSIYVLPAPALQLTP